MRPGRPGRDARSSRPAAVRPRPWPRPAGAAPPTPRRRRRRSSSSRSVACSAGRGNHRRSHEHARCRGSSKASGLRVRAAAKAARGAAARSVSIRLSRAPPRNGLPASRRSAARAARALAVGPDLPSSATRVDDSGHWPCNWASSVGRDSRDRRLQHLVLERLVTSGSASGDSRHRPALVRERLFADGLRAGAGSGAAGSASAGGSSIIGTSRGARRQHQYRDAGFQVLVVDPARCRPAARR
jgi:hypothetical protein